MRIFLLMVLFGIHTAYSADTKQYQLHWGINLEPLDFYIPAAHMFKKRVEKKTNGQIRVKLSIGHYKQDERDHLKDVASGVYDMGQETINNLHKYDSRLGLWDLPFLFRSNAQVFKYTESPHAKSVLKSLEKAGVVGIEYTYSGGFLHLFGEEVNSFKSLEGKNVAHEEYSPNYKKALSEKLDVTFKEYGQRSSDIKLSEIISSTLYEISDFPEIGRMTLNRTEHRVFARIIFVSKKFLNKLPNNLKQIVLDEAKRAGIFEREMAVKETEVYIAELKKQGMKINNWSGKQKALGRKLFKSMYRNFEQKHGVDTLKKIDALN